MLSTNSQADAETKRARRQAALKRYALKHKQKLRSSGRERMQRVRSQPMTKEQTVKKLDSASAYRKKNRELIREADSHRRKEMTIVKQRAEDKKREHAQREQKCRARKRAPLLPALPNAAPRRTTAPRDLPSQASESESDSEPETPRGAEIPDEVFYGNPARLHSPTPDIFCDCTWPKYCLKCTCGCDYMCCLYHHDDESEYRRWMKELTCEERGLPSPYKETVDYKFE